MFTYVGKEQGVEYICRQVGSSCEAIEGLPELETCESARKQGRSGFRYAFTTFLGYFVNCFGCCFAYVCLNWCCVWRWVCCHGPPVGCCRRYCSFDYIEPLVETGDIFLFSGTKEIRLCTGSHWSHMGIALHDTEGQFGPKGFKYVFEENFGFPGWEHADLRLLREKVTTYKKGRVDIGWRSLKVDAETRKVIAHSIARHRGAPYEHNLARMTLAMLDCCPCCEMGIERDTNDDRHTMFCSEIVACVLQDAHLLPREPHGPPPHEYIPRDFDGTWGGNLESYYVSLSGLQELYLIKRSSNSWSFF